MCLLLIRERFLGARPNICGKLHRNQVMPASLVYQAFGFVKHSRGQIMVAHIVCSHAALPT